ncbi:MAG: molybdopterin-guanine dinucleotide biosynthesis protein B [Candidatus Tectomicrobia bacterium]|nr:molybdopterin-guanine dinucleotide biosynthesis protein B [Candidatus Tectomicrobia bacterium]
MVPIVSIVGLSGSGKTTLMERLIPELKRRSYRIGTIKHDAHRFEIDHPGKDTWRHAQAGADAVAISSSEKIALIKRVSAEPSLRELEVMGFLDVDLILTEGYKRGKEPKIEVVPPGISSPQLICSGEDNLIAVVSDEARSGSLPWFARGEIEKIADFLEKRYLKPREPQEIQLIVSGREIPLNTFLQGFFINTIRGMLVSLKGVEAGDDVMIQVKGKEVRNS